MITSVHLVIKTVIEHLCRLKAALFVHTVKHNALICR